MTQNSVYVLVHSPLVGPLTWRRVADEMLVRGLTALVPTLEDSPASNDPFWKQNAESAARDIADIPDKTPVILVAHSGAGPLLPAIGQFILNPVQAYVFVDAGIPRDGATRLDLMRSEDPEWAAQFHEELERGGRFPTWSFDDLQEAIPDLSLRKQMVAELRPRGLSFFTEPIPVFEGWSDAPCIYIHLSAPYNKPASQARAAGWPTYKLDAGHFHMLVDPAKITDLIVHSVNKISSKTS